MVANSSRCSGTRLKPAAARSSISSRAMSWPAKVTRPFSGMLPMMPDAAIVQTDRKRGLARLRRHHEGDREFFAALAVAGPVRQQIAWEAGIADNAAMGAAVAQSRHRKRIAQHLVHGIEIAVGVVQERHIEHATAVIAQHGVICQFFRPFSL